MKKVFLGIFFLFFLYGCASTCLFGRSDDPGKLKCISFLAQAKEGMTQKEVEKTIGLPQRREFDKELRGKRYDEVWIYDTTPPTILYFKGNVLQHKEYQQ